MNTKHIWMFLLLAAFTLAHPSCRGEDALPFPDIPILDAVTQGNVMAVQGHIDAGTDLNVVFVPRAPGVPAYGGSPLHLAVLFEYENIASLLLNNGADINIRAKDEPGGTPLNWAVWVGNSQMVKFLVEAGADVNAPDKNGYTPLDSVIGSQFIKKADRKQIAAILRENGGKTRQ